MYNNLPWQILLLPISSLVISNSSQKSFSCTGTHQRVNYHYWEVGNNGVVKWGCFSLPCIVYLVLSRVFSPTLLSHGISGSKWCFAIARRECFAIALRNKYWLRSPEACYPNCDRPFIHSDFPLEKKPGAFLNARSRRECCAIACPHVQYFPLRRK